MPWLCSSAMTPDQLAASANAPWTRTTVGVDLVMSGFSPRVSGGVQGGTQGGDGHRDGGLGGVGAAQGVEHHEVVDDALETHRGDRDAGLTELVGVGLALVAQHVGLA